VRYHSEYFSKYQVATLIDVSQDDNDCRVINL